MSFDIKRTYVDTQPGIELVNIHYTWTPVGQQPEWEQHRETRAMPRGGTLIRGLGGTTVAESRAYVQTLAQTVELPDDGVRRKVLRLPTDVYDPAAGRYVEHYAFHHCFEVFRDGQREVGPVYTEEMVSKEVEYIVYTSNLGAYVSSRASMTGMRPSINQPKSRALSRSSARTARIDPPSSTGARTRRPSAAFAPKCYRRYQRRGGSWGRCGGRRGQRCITVGTWVECGLRIEINGGRAIGAMWHRRSEVRSAVGCTRRSPNHQGRTDWPKLQCISTSVSGKTGVRVGKRDPVMAINLCGPLLSPSQ